ncbi:neutral zinc metallopeptidase [Nocardioides sp. DS6]|uniref:Neutral zinc metallopeptidase n=1 Tax=Nocardioides eburneus TaxID=3231482 RepID=A0ABV3T0X9_9ACTN
MRFNPKARLDTSRTRDVGGSGGGGGLSGGLGGGSLPIPGGKAGGGIGTIVVLLVLFLVGQCTGIGPQLGGSGGSLDTSAFTGGSAQGAGLDGQSFDYSQCQTGDDANDNENCALVAVENSLTDYWSQQPQMASRFQPEKAIEVFHGSVQTDGCGSATTDVGPFYCPGDSTIYLDTAFYDTVFKQLGGQDTTFVRAYVIAHEYGHHIQNLLGTMSRVKTQQGATSDSVRLELQADCYAGMWAAHAEGDGFVEDITDQDVSEGISAAHDVGDDYIQNKMGGGSNPESWTHGSSAEREAWFKAGMNAGDDMNACDTFSARDLTNP